MSHNEAKRKTDGNKPKNRPKRVPIGTRDVLTAPKREGYVRRFVNDSEGRVEMFKEAGYSVVLDKEIQVGDPGAGKDSPVGSPVRKHVGDGKYAILMEQREEWYNEDQMAKQKKIGNDEQAMFESANKQEGHYGGITTS